LWWNKLSVMVLEIKMVWFHCRKYLQFYWGCSMSVFLLLNFESLFQRSKCLNSIHIAFRINTVFEIICITVFRYFASQIYQFI
jgi:hypothetical protein